jgi:NADH dehydrogenase I D subunit
MSEDTSLQTQEDAEPAETHVACAKLQERFGDEVVEVVETCGQWTAVSRSDRITEILTFLRDESGLEFDRLTDLTAVDYSEYPGGGHDGRFHIVYELYSHSLNHRFRLRALVPDDESIPSACSVWRGANWPEREVFDMFGIRFEGHPDLRRILMPVNFQHYPLRKDYPLKGRGERDVIAPEDPGFVGNPFADSEEEPEDDPISSERMILNLGPQHPATHGTLRLTLELDGEKVTRCIPDIGYLHTGFEKLGEHHTYNQWVTVTDRMNYLSPLSNNIGYSLAVENMMGLEAPPRAQYVRVILAELSRIADHVVWLGTHALDIGAMTVFLYTFEQRERLYNIFELVTGTRLTTSYTRIGGLGWDVPEDFHAIVTDFTSQFPAALEEVDRLLTRNRIWIDRTKGIGVISGDDAIAWNVTGPMLRGSGVNYDLRKDEPYLCYEDLEFDIPVGANGDVYDRYLVRMEELRQSNAIVEQAVNNLPEGPVKVDDSKVILPEKDQVYSGMESLIHHFKITMDDHGLTPPPGEMYTATEAPNGELGFYVVSDGSGSAYRMRVRPPSFMNYQCFPEMVEGLMVADVVAVLGSMNVIAGELDR